MKLRWITGIMAALLISSCSAPDVAEEIALIPQVREITQQQGSYTIKANAVIGISDENLQPAATYLGAMLQLAKIEKGNADINLIVDGSLTNTDEYRLEINKSGITITGQSYRGVMLGIQTLRQLLPAEIEKKSVVNTKLVLPLVNISDHPREQWRGLMLDVSRHFFTPAEVKELLDIMALYKFNKFHWHLSDDQGWRIEIKKYPLLTEKGAFRKLNSQDRECMRMRKEQQNPDFDFPADRIKVVENDTIYGGFYTQEEIKDIVAYAGQRGIDVIPEIDMPGHFSAAIANYPYLACFNQAGWGHTFSAPICPGKDEVLEFCKDVYSEVFQLFPFEYVHLGADEVEKDNWKKCPNCQKRIKTEGLKDEFELQSWFVKSMEKFFNENGKKLLGWDEILEGGLSETATIMWWRSWVKDAVHRATAQGNNAVMAPNSYFYFDYAADVKTLQNVYSFNPELEGLSKEQFNKVLGLQANIWAEWIPSRERMQYMIFPRMTALAEVAWGTANPAEFENYRQRLVPHFNRWDIMNINYRIPDLEGFESKNVFIGSTDVTATCILPSVEIRYTTDGSVPTKESTLYTGPVNITETTTFTFRSFRKNGTADVPVKTEFVKQELAEPANVDKSTLKEGLQCKIYEKKYVNCENFTDGAKLLNTISVDKVAIPQGAKGWLGLEFDAYIEVPEDGIYSFALLSDDGSRLYINDYLVVDNDGAHGPRELSGQYAMKAGLHALKIHYFDGNNGGSLGLKVYSSSKQEVAVKYFH